ncbi:SLIT and NTRK-like protein 2 [Dufourea novaeangliae]|uniref:SLIT and NTRK-like protein 2 n=1 Tax=Dufourea novaeangliae TaxID=178035 RepID=A0A154PBD6_DUFNO|nr:SLIT and NTRK-like protein 2 [Dufourea novaeangliae]
MIFNSNLRYIPERAFVKYSRSLQSLNIHKCQFRDIHMGAFDGLSSLKKLSLPNNNISNVKEEWFKDTVYLEQLDLSYNHITRLESTIFSRMLLLKRLDIRENRLTCFDYKGLPGGIDKVYFSGNPFTFKCRGQLTLWMRDHGVSYKTEQSEKETWLDKLLWLCAIDNPEVAESEILIKECVILSLFNQLRTGLSTAESYPLFVSGECQEARNRLTDCVANEAQNQRTYTNGNVIAKLFLYLREANLSNLARTTLNGIVELSASRNNSGYGVNVNAPETDDVFRVERLVHWVTEVAERLRLKLLGEIEMQWKEP